MLTKTAAGWVWIGPHKDQMRFDRSGRLVAIADAVRHSDGTGGVKPTGNEMRFPTTRRGGWCGSPTRSTGLPPGVRRGWPADELTDFDGRRSSTPTTRPAGCERHLAGGHGGESPFPDGLTTTYTYEPASGDLAGQLTQRDNLASITDARGIDCST